MNRNYQGAARGLPHQALAVACCEAAGIDMERVQHVAIDCPVDSYPIVTFTTVLLNSSEVAELVSYKMSPITQESTT